MAEQSYLAAHRRSIAEPQRFWGEQASLVDWIRAPERVLDDSSAPFYRWFPNATLNTCHNAVDRHVAAGHGDRAALIYDSPVTGTVRRHSYAELLAEVEEIGRASCRERG